MSKQGEMFFADIPGVLPKTVFIPLRAPYQPHSETSKEAAAQIAPILNPLQQKVLDCLQRWPEGLTDEQLCDALGMNPSTCRPRRIELVSQKLVRDSERKRKTRSGRSAVIWVAL